MDKNKKKSLEEMSVKERLEGLQKGAGTPIQQPKQIRPFDNLVTQDDMDRARAVQELLLQNSPTKGMIQPNAQDLMQQDLEQQQMLNELDLDSAQEVQPKRFQKLLGK